MNELQGYLIKRLKRSYYKSSRSFIFFLTRLTISFSGLTSKLFPKTFIFAAIITNTSIMSLDKLLLLGDPLLHKQSVRLEFSELKELKPLVEILHETLMAFRKKYGAGRAIDNKSLQHRPGIYNRIK